MAVSEDHASCWAHKDLTVTGVASDVVKVQGEDHNCTNQTL